MNCDDFLIDAAWDLLIVVRIEPRGVLLKDVPQIFLPGGLRHSFRKNDKFGIEKIGEGPDSDSYAYKNNEDFLHGGESVVSRYSRIKRVYDVSYEENEGWEAKACEAGCYDSNIEVNFIFFGSKSVKFAK